MMIKQLLLKRILVICTLITGSILYVEAQDRFSFNGYTGGMMVHAGYVRSGAFTISDYQTGDNETLKISGMTKGIGGAVKFKFGEHIRIGGEGYVSTIYYGSKGSFVEFGWGGFLADYSWNLNKWTPFVGLNIGGGSVKNLVFVNKSSGDFIADARIVSRKYGTLSLTPFMGFEYSVTGKISVVFKVDYNSPLGKREDDVTSGVRFHVGMLFNRISK